MFHSKKLNLLKNINHVFFSRNNGFSKGLYKSLNCGEGSQDNEKDINKNLAYVSQKMGVSLTKLKLMNQTHSNKVVVINKKNAHLKKFDCDAMVTNIKGLALGVLTADCVPIILFCSVTNTIACIHAGWKGSLSGIIENTLSNFKDINSKNKIIAAVGPCISIENYEVDKYFKDQFIKKSKKNDNFFKPKNNDKFLFNLRGYVNHVLDSNGVEIVDNLNLDTFNDSENFYSYRRSQINKEEDYGRCISVITLKNI